MRYALLFGAAFAMSCAEGRPAPDNTLMVPITENLTFWYGDDTPCIDKDKGGDKPHDCGKEYPDNVVGTTIIVPPTKVSLDAFCIDRHEVTNLQYLYCEEMGECPRRPFDNLGNDIVDYGANSRYDQYPAVAASAADAKAY